MNEMEARRYFWGLGKEPLGLYGENCWRGILTSCGLKSIPLAKIISTDGPEQIILPDKDLFHVGYMENKCKRGPGYLRKAYQYRVGINRVNYEHYLAASSEAQKHCYLAVVECFVMDEATWKFNRLKDIPAWSGCVYLKSFQALGKPDQEKGMGDQGHMCYWDRNRFFLLTRLSALEVDYYSRDPAPDPSFKGRLREFFQVESNAPLQRSLF